MGNIKSRDFIRRNPLVAAGVAMALAAGVTFVVTAGQSGDEVQKWEDYSGDQIMVIHGSGAVNMTGGLVLTGTGAGGCIQIKDTDDSGWTKCTYLNGTETCAIGTC